MTCPRHGSSIWRASDRRSEALVINSVITMKIWKKPGGLIFADSVRTIIWMAALLNFALRNCAAVNGGSVLNANEKVPAVKVGSQ